MGTAAQWLSIPCLLLVLASPGTGSAATGKSDAPPAWPVPLYDAPLAAIRMLLDRDRTGTVLRMGNTNMGYLYDGATNTFYYNAKKGVQRVWLTGSFNRWSMQDSRWELRPAPGNPRRFTLAIPAGHFGKAVVYFKFFVQYDGKNNYKWEIYPHDAGPGQWD